MPSKYGFGNNRKAKKAARKESRAHDKSARKTFREDHPNVFGRMRLKFGGKYKSNRKFLKDQNESRVKRRDTK
jgi:hypothetical protein